MIKSFDNRKEKLEIFTNKMGMKLVNSEERRNTYSSKMLDISKPGRPEVKEWLQKQLESIR